MVRISVNVHVFSAETSGQYISECKYTNSLSINDRYLYYWSLHHTCTGYYMYIHVISTSTCKLPAYTMY